ncbi:MAG: DUF547 domain-containing protein [Chitinophagales bacterium]|nr:DUF547 domain-containing protein [Bacteroidota bacterium]MCB9043987.1 DUF547 domain-containing protein [Chitinophagales bacterium]
MKKTFYCLFLCSFLGFYQCTFSQVSPETTPLSHEIWNSLLQQHVSPDGHVNYKGFIKDSLQLNRYLALLEKTNAQNTNWSESEKLAYWINAYNAFTVRLIIRHYPLESIKDITKINIPFINSPWDIKFIRIEEQTYDLNYIEHSVLRKKFEEPRIHFAINCASKSCPNLLNEAYLPETLEQQLQTAAIKFINNPQKNKLSGDEVALSEIFSWFKGDFTKKTSLIQFIHQYANTPLSEKAKINYLDYDWSLNE